MERIRHIAETHKLNTDEGELSVVIPKTDNSFEKQSTENTPEHFLVQKYLESLNWPALAEIIQGIVRKTGRDPKELRLIPPSEVILYSAEQKPQFGEMNGFYNGAIHLNVTDLAHNPVNAVHAYVHELLHALSNNTYTEKETDAEVYYYHQNIGLQKKSFRISTNELTNETREFNLLDEFLVANEGYTEFLTEKILQEYLQQTGDIEMYGRDSVATHFEYAHEEHHYGEYRKRIECYAAVIATLAEIPLETVHDALTRAYFRSADPAPLEVAEALEELSPGLYLQILDLLNEESLYMNPVDLARELFYLDVFSYDQIDVLIKEVKKQTQAAQDYWDKRDRKHPNT